MNKYFSRNDIILIAAILMTSLIGIFIINLFHKSGDKALVYVDGRLVYEYQLSEGVTVNIEGYNGGVNTLKITDGFAYMEEASCPDKLCIHQGKINRSGQTIVCLPNRVVVKIVGKDDGEYDAITR